jgi:4-hydroxy 2-oxovalerate aldolase
MSFSSDKRIQLLDCTLRDGGFSNDFNFGRKNISTVILNLSEANIDIIELGFLESDSRKGDEATIYTTFESLDGNIPSSIRQDQQFTGMITYPAFPIELLPERRTFSRCDAIRVIIRYSELLNSLDFCKQIAQKGYKVFMQPAITMRYSRDELQMLFDTANELDVYALYIVDSYGYMHNGDVIDFFQLFDRNLNDTIRIGFHAHNNLNLAFSNALGFLKYPTSRKIIIDSCLLGMGQGSGNLQTEIFVDFMNKNMLFNHEYDHVLEACEIVEKYFVETPWGYSVVDLLAAINKTSYRYSRVLRSEHNLSFSQIHRILSNIPENLRHRYTPENTKRLLEYSTALLQY